MAPVAGGTMPNSSAHKIRPAMLQVIDHRGNVVVVDGGVRLAGAITAIPAFFVAGTEVEVLMIVGFEPARLRVIVLEGCDGRPGAIAIVSLAEWTVGGRRFVPNDAAYEQHEADDIAMQGRLQDVPVVEVVQLVCSGKRAATIEVRDERGLPASCGRIGVRGGRVVSASTEDDVVGEEAFFALLGAPRGRFRVRFSDGEPLSSIENIERDTTFLLLEFLRILDEAGIPPPAAPVVDGPITVRPAMTLPAPVPEVAGEPSSERKRPPLPRAQAAPVTGRFSRFFTEVSASLPQLKTPAHASPPPVATRDEPRFGNDANGFASLEITLNGEPMAFERDTDIVDRTQISH